MGEADLAGITRDGVRWALIFEGSVNDKIVTSERLRDVIKIIEANAALISEKP